MLLCYRCGCGVNALILFIINDNQGKEVSANSVEKATNTYWTSYTFEP